MKVLYRYFLILIACTAILFGVQIPNFVDQYEKRLDAHFLEVQNNLRRTRKSPIDIAAGRWRYLYKGTRKAKTGR